MSETQSVQQPASLCVFRDRNYRALVVLNQRHAGLNCSHYGNRSEVWLQLRRKITKILAYLLPDDAQDANHLSVHNSNISPHRSTLGLTKKLNHIIASSDSGDYLRRLIVLCSTDCILAIEAKIVAGRGAVALRHILASGSQDPPNGKLSSWYEE